MLIPYRLFLAPCRASPRPSTPDHTSPDTASLTLEGTLLRMFYRLLPAPRQSPPRLAVPILTRPCRASPLPSIPSRALASRTLEGQLIELPIDCFQFLAAPSRGRPLLAKPGHSIPNPVPPNTRRMTVTNHLSTIASSSPDQTRPYRTVPHRALPFVAQPCR